MFYSGVNPKMTDALKQWKKQKKKKDTHQIEQVIS